MLARAAAWLPHSKDRNRRDLHLAVVVLEVL